MIIPVLLGVIALLAIMNLALWKSGAVGTAEAPTTLIDKPVMDLTERKAFLKRLKRWKQEGKVNRAEYEHFYQLCHEEWDPAGGEFDA